MTSYEEFLPKARVTENVSLTDLEHLLNTLDEDPVPYEDEEAEVDYQVEVKKRILDEQLEEEALIGALALENGEQQGGDDQVYEDHEDEIIASLAEGKLNFLEEDIELPQSEVPTDANIIVTEGLSKIASDFNEPFTKSLVGAATLLKTSPREPHLIAIGTTNGVVLLYNRETCKRIAILGTLCENSKHSVTSIEFGPKDSDILVVGAKSGNVTFYSLQNYKPFKTVEKKEALKITNIGLLSDYVTQSSYSFIACDSSSNLAVYTVKKTGATTFTVDIFAMEASHIAQVKLRETPSAPSSPRSRAYSSAEAPKPGSDDLKLGDIKPMPHTEGLHAINKQSLVAFSFRGKVVILSLSSTPRVVKILQDPTESTTNEFPVLAWRRGEVPNGKYDSPADVPSASNPVLAVGWRNVILLYSVTLNSELSFGVEVTLLPLKIVHANVKSLHFVYCNSLICRTEQNEFLLLHIDDNHIAFDAKTDSIEKFSLGESSGNILSLDVAFRQGIKNVTEGKPVSVLRDSSILVALTDASNEKAITTFQVKGWKARLEDLKNSSTIEALKFVIDIYNNKGHVIIGLPEDTRQKRQVIVDEISYLLNKYIDEELKNTIEKTFRPEEKQQAYRELGKTCIDYALQIQNYAIFWELYQKFKVEATQTFLNLLPQFILDPPSGNSLLTLFNGAEESLFHDFVSFFIAEEKFEELENCLLNISIVREKEAHEKQQEYEEYCVQFFKGLREKLEPIVNDKAELLRIYALVQDLENADQCQYVRPLHKLFELYEIDSEHQPQIGKAALDLVSHYILGKGLSPAYILPDNTLVVARKRLLEYIFLGKHVPAGSATLDLSPLAILINNGSSIFFSCMEKCFFDRSNASPWLNEVSDVKSIISEDFGDDDDDDESEKEHQKQPKELSRQYVLKVLSDTMLKFKYESQSSSVLRRVILRDVYLEASNLTFKKTAMYDFFTFLVHVVSEAPHSSKPFILAINIDQLYHAINFLTNDEECDDGVRNKRETGLLTLMKKFDKNPTTVLEYKERIAEKAEKAKFYKIGIYTYTTLQKYSNVVGCYLKDDFLRDQVFQYIHNMYEQHTNRKWLNSVFGVPDMSDTDTLALESLSQFKSETPEEQKTSTERAEQEQLRELGKKLQKFEVQDKQHYRNYYLADYKTLWLEDTPVNMARYLKSLIERIEKKAPVPKIESYDLIEVDNKLDLRIKNMEEAVSRYLVELIQTNPTKFAQLVIQRFPSQNSKFITQLQKLTQKKKEAAPEDSEDDRYLYDYLKCLFDRRADNVFDSDNSNSLRPEDIRYLYVQLLCKHNPAEVTDFLEKYPSSKTDEILKYCEGLIKDLQSKNRVGQNIEQLQNIVCYLFEKKGEITLALNKIETKLRMKCNDIVDLLEAKAKEVDPNGDVPQEYASFDIAADSGDVAAILIRPLPKIRELDVDKLPETISFFNELQFGIQVCAQNTLRKTVDEPKTLWFRMLATFVKPLRKLRYEEMKKPLPKDLSVDNSLQEDLSSTDHQIETLRNEISGLEQEFRDEFISEEDYKDQVEKKKNLLNFYVDTRERLIELIEESKTKHLNKAMIPLKPLTTLWLQKIVLLGFQAIVQEMINYIPIADILTQLIEDNRSDELGQIKASVLRMLEIYEYENFITKHTNEKIIDIDNYLLAQKYRSSLSKGIRTMNNYCPICGDDAIAKEAITVKLFNCGHLFHTRCVGRNAKTCCICVDRRSAARNDTTTDNEKQKDQIQATYTEMKLSKMQTVETALEDRSKMHLQKSLEVAALHKKNSSNLRDAKYATFVANVNLAPAKRNIVKPPLKTRAVPTAENRLNPLDDITIDFKSLDKIASLYI